jgi:hypothetical protein
MDFNNLKTDTSFADVSAFLEWVDEQHTDIQYDVYPLQYKFEDQRKASLMKIYAHIKMKTSCNNDAILTYKSVESLYELIKDSKPITSMEFIVVLNQYVLQKQILYISKITREENVPFQVGSNAFRYLETTHFNPFNIDLFRLVIRIHYRTMIRFSAITTAFNNVFLSMGKVGKEEDVMKVLIKNFDEKAINVFASSMKYNF